MVGHQVVVAAVIRDRRGRLLLARRRPGSHLEGLWEFPGGRMEQGESAEQALVRELDEELGVKAVVGDPMTFAWHRDGEREVLLLFYRVQLESGAPTGREGQQVGWFHVHELLGLEMPPADIGLVRVLLSEARGDLS